MASTSTAPATSSAPTRSPAERRRHQLYRLMARAHRISDTTLVLALPVGVGGIAVGAWLVSLAHGNAVLWTGVATLLLWFTVMWTATAIREFPAPTPPTVVQQGRPTIGDGAYRIGFTRVIENLTRETAWLTRHRSNDPALIEQWATLRDEAVAADRLGRGARVEREAVVARWNLARAAHPGVFVVRPAPWTRRTPSPVVRSAVLDADRADGRYITYPIAQRMRALRTARAEITMRHLLVTTAVIAALAAPFLGWAALHAMWHQTTTGQVVPAHLDSALGGVIWCAGVIAGGIVALIGALTGWYAFADTARRRQVARAITTAVIVELVWLAASLWAAVVVLTVMVTS